MRSGRRRSVCTGAWASWSAREGRRRGGGRRRRARRRVRLHRKSARRVGNWRKNLKRNNSYSSSGRRQTAKIPQEAARRRRLADDRGDVDDAERAELAEIDAHCTFTPTISRKSREIHASLVRRASSATKTPSSFVERSKVWARRKEEILEAEREAKREGDLRDCTFQPVTCDATSSSPMAVAKTPTPGLESYLARQERARKMREERDAKLNRPDGSSWRHETTVPQEFSFQTASTARARATRPRNSTRTREERSRIARGHRRARARREKNSVRLFIVHTSTAVQHDLNSTSTHPLYLSIYPCHPAPLATNPLVATAAADDGRRHRSRASPPPPSPTRSIRSPTRAARRTRRPRRRRFASPRRRRRGAAVDDASPSRASIFTRWRRRAPPFARAPSDENPHEREEREEREKREDVRAVSSRVVTTARDPTGVARPRRVQPARGALRERFPDRRSRRAHRVLVRRRLRGDERRVAPRPRAVRVGRRVRRPIRARPRARPINPRRTH